MVIKPKLRQSVVLTDKIIKNMLMCRKLSWSWIVRMKAENKGESEDERGRETWYEDIFLFSSFFSSLLWSFDSSHTHMYVNIASSQLSVSTSL